MKTPYRCTIKVCDEKGSSTIGYTSSQYLANLLAIGTGVNIEEIIVWETENDLPDSIKNCLNGNHDVEIARWTRALKETEEQLQELIESPLPGFFDFIGICERPERIKQLAWARDFFRSQLQN